MIESLHVFTGDVNTRLTVGISSNARISPSGYDMAMKFGVPLDENCNPSTFATAFLSRLLLQRKKIVLGLLDDQLSSTAKETLREVLKCLEDKHRKLIGLGSGSMVFVLFCPTSQSYEQLFDKTWMDNLTSKLQNFLMETGECSLFTQCHATVC